MSTAMLNENTIKKLAIAIQKTRDDEIGCEECYEALDRFVEMLRAGKKAQQVMPLVQAHLEMCRDCREEFELLLEVLEQQTS